MSKQCAICGKSKMSGNNVSHSKRRTPKTYSANLHKVKVEIEGKESTEYVCTRCLRTANKNEK
ncbi:MAG TPA: 50S ribosomal protein L28 [Eubacteriales bacterium]|nr:50S ribosomal protein L28 [Clostridia bacterium]HRX13943.1 50S ribosomal protein L28 [Eubacteriales bacterium]